MKVILIFMPVLAMLALNGCARQHNDGWLIHALSKRLDESEIRELIKKKSFSLDATLNALWLALTQKDIRKRMVADDAFVRISRGVLLSPCTFEMKENDYWDEMARFYVAKYKLERNEEMKRATAIYVRQIRRHESTMIADEADAPSLKELTGVDLEESRL